MIIWKNEFDTNYYHSNFTKNYFLQTLIELVSIEFAEPFRMFATSRQPQSHVLIDSHDLHMVG